MKRTIIPFLFVSIIFFSCSNNSREIEINKINNHLTKTSKIMEQYLAKQEMKEKLALYTFAWDEGKPEEFRKYYTDDIQFDVYKPGGTEFFYGFKGIEEHIKGNAVTTPIRNAGGSLRHNLSETAFLELTENTARTKTVYSFSIFFKANASESSPLVVSGTFNDSWVKTDDKGWIVKKRVIIYDNLPQALLN